MEILTENQNLEKYEKKVELKKRKKNFSVKKKIRKNKESYLKSIEKAKKIEKTPGGFPFFKNNKDEDFLSLLNFLYKITKITKRKNFASFKLKSFENLEIIEKNEKKEDFFNKYLEIAEKLKKNSNDFGIEMDSYNKKKVDLLEFENISNGILGILFEISNKRNEFFEIDKIHITSKLLEYTMEENYQLGIQKILKKGFPKLIDNKNYNNNVINNIFDFEKKDQNNEVFLNTNESFLKKFRINVKEKFFFEEETKKICNFFFVYFEPLGEKIQKTENEKNEENWDFIVNIKEFYTIFYSEKKDFLEKEVLATDVRTKIGFRSIIN